MRRLCYGRRRENVEMKKRHYTPFAFKEHIGHFLKPLDVLGITTNFKIGYCNLPKIKIFLFVSGGCGDYSTLDPREG